MREVDALPPASAMIESMRDIGYSLETAIADIIDNSLAAKATSIEVSLRYMESEEPSLSIIDNGEGMTEDELLQAMKPGCRHPLDDREVGDLGRFGLGMKTASFSQCRLLTVVSRKDGLTTSARWDLDLVRQHDSWRLLVLDDEEVAELPNIAALGPQGTMVLWESLDRLLDATSGAQQRQNVYRAMEVAKEHVSSVFHRFLRTVPGHRRVEVLWNDLALDPFDPFHSDHPATQATPEEVIRVHGSEVVVQAFTLPHHDKVSAKEWERYATSAGYLRTQGFYVYRERRLIIRGTWFRLAKQAEITKLARVRVDIPTTLDHLWKIDIRKASAQPPFVVRERLKGIIDKIVKPAKRVYMGRGHRRVSRVQEPFWNRLAEQGGKVSYVVDAGNPVIAEFRSSLDPEQRALFSGIVAGINRGVPLSSMFADLASSPNSVKPPELSDDQCRSLVLTVAQHHLTSGKTAGEAVELVRNSELYTMNTAAADRTLEYFIRSQDANA